MVPEVFVSDELKRARKLAQRHADCVQRETGCSVLTIVAEFDGLRVRTALAEDRALVDDSASEGLLLRSAVSRIASLLVLQMGKADAFCVLMSGFREGVRLALEAQDRSSAPG